MRYAQDGGLSDERRQFREGVRMRAAERFAQGEPSSVIAKELRVSVRSVQRRRAWEKGGPQALRSTGSASPPGLSEPQFGQLEVELAKEPPRARLAGSAVGIKTVIGRRFHKSYTLQGVCKLLIRHGFSCQVPARRAVERDEEEVTGWVKETSPQVEGPRRRSTPGSPTPSSAARSCSSGTTSAATLLTACGSSSPGTTG